jgi:hypothetical protein
MTGIAMKRAAANAELPAIADRVRNIVRCPPDCAPHLYRMRRGRPLAGSHQKKMMNEEKHPVGRAERNEAGRVINLAACGT